MYLHNLQEKNSRLVPVPAPASVTDLAGLCLLGVWAFFDHVVKFFCRGGVVLYSRDNEPPRALFDIPEERRYTFFNCSSHEAVIEVPGATFNICFDNTFTPCVIRRAASLPQPVFRSLLHHSSTIEAPLDACRLTGQYTHADARLSHGDSTAISQAMVKSYTAVADSATAAGHFTAPVFVRYRLINHRGNRTFCSEPVLVTPAAGVSRPRARVDIDAAGKRTLPTTFPMTAFDCQACLTAAEITELKAAGIREIHIDVSPQVHPVLPGHISFPHLDSKGNDFSTVVPLPGTDSPRIQSQLAARLLNADAEPGEASPIFRPVLSIILDPAQDDGDMAVNIPPMLNDAADEIKRVAALPIPAAEVAEPDIDGEFRAECCRQESDLILMWNIMTRDAAPSPLAYLNTSSARGAEAPLEARVTHVTGTTRSSTVTGSSRDVTPGLLNPCISHPGAGYGTVEIALRDSEGSARARTLPLTPLGCHSAYIDPSLAAIAVDTPADDFDCPPDDNEPVPRDGWIVTCDREGRPLARLDTGLQSIVAILPAPRATSTVNDASRRKFLIFSASGIHVTTIDGRGRIAAPVALHAAGVKTASAVVAGSDPGGAPVIYAIAGGDLLQVTASAVRVLERDVGYTMLAWDPVVGRLLMINPGETTAGIYTGDPQRVMTRSIPPVDYVINASDGSLLAGPEGLYDLSRQLPYSPRCILSSLVTVPAPHPWRGVPPVSELHLDLNTPRASGTVTIYPSSFSDEVLSPPPDGARGISQLRIEGPVTHPMVHRVVAPPSLNYIVTLDALLHPETSLTPPGLSSQRAPRAPDLPKS